MSKVKLDFSLLSAQSCELIRYYYNHNDYSIEFCCDVAPLAISEPHYSIAVKDVEFDIDMNDGGLLRAHGFSPIDAWRRASLRVPESEDGRVFVVGYNSLRLGVTYNIDSISDDVILYDDQTGWVCMGTEPSREHVGIKCSPSLLVVFERDNATSIWIKLE